MVQRCIIGVTFNGQGGHSQGDSTLMYKSRCTTTKTRLLRAIDTPTEGSYHRGRQDRGLQQGSRRVMCGPQVGVRIYTRFFLFTLVLVRGLKDRLFSGEGCLMIVNGSMFFHLLQNGFLWRCNTQIKGDMCYIARAMSGTYSITHLFVGSLNRVIHRLTLIYQITSNFFRINCRVIGLGVHTTILQPLRQTCAYNSYKVNVHSH